MERKLGGLGSFLSASLLSVVAGAAGCGNSTTAGPPTGDGDGSVGTGPAMLTGTVYGASADTGARTPLASAGVHLIDQSGTELASVLTGGDGRFAINAPPGWLGFLMVEPGGGYTGYARAQESMQGWEVYDVVIPEEAGVARECERAGTPYDPAKGLVAVGINPVSQAAGGEGATVSAPHDPAFVLAAGAVIVGERLPPICAAGVAEGTGGCTTLARSNNIFFPNVQGTSAAVSPLSPSGGTCSLRYGISAWLVAPHVLTNVDVDCM